MTTHVFPTVDIRGGNAGNELDPMEIAVLDRLFANPLVIEALFRYSRAQMLPPSRRGYDIFYAAMEDRATSFRQFSNDLTEVIRMYTTQPCAGPRPPRSVYESEMQKRIDRVLVRFAGHDIRDVSDVIIAIADREGGSARERILTALEYQLVTIQKAMAAVGEDGSELAIALRDSSLFEKLARLKVTVGREPIANAMLGAAEQLLSAHIHCAAAPAKRPRERDAEISKQEEEEEAPPAAKKPRIAEDKTAPPIAAVAVGPSDNSDSSEESGDEVEHSAEPPPVCK